MALKILRLRKLSIRARVCQSILSTTMQAGSGNYKVLTKSDKVTRADASRPAAYRHHDRRVDGQLDRTWHGTFPLGAHDALIVGVASI